MSSFFKIRDLQDLFHKYTKTKSNNDLSFLINLLCIFIQTKIQAEFPTISVFNEELKLS